MDTFEDDNPFENDMNDRVPSETSSTSKVNISAPSSPPVSARLLSPTKPFSSPGTQRQSQQSFKSDFCCYRDRWLHSGEDAEIQVCARLASVLTSRPLMSVRDKITDAQKTTLNSSTPYITYVIHAGVSISHGIADRASDADSHVTDRGSQASVF